MTELIAPVLVAILVSYFLGNINGAITVSGLYYQDDVRTHGSGNAGMTNYLRSYGLKRTCPVLLIDLGKAILACVMGGMLLRPYGYELEGILLAGLFVSLGHDLPVLQGFKGGKGILCGLGLGIVSDWRAAGIALMVFLIVVLLTKYVSLGSCLAAIALGIMLSVFHWGRPWAVALVCAACGLAVFMHRENISRLLRGEERKLSFHGKEGKT